KKLAGMVNVGFSFELGVYIEYEIPLANVHLEVSQDLAGGHKGATIDLDTGQTLEKDADIAIGESEGNTFATADRKSVGEGERIVRGVVIACDVADRVCKHALTVGGMGCAAARHAEKYLSGAEA